MATLYAESDLPYQNLYRRHRRNDSGELDVFDATSYFSGEEMQCHADPLNTGRHSQKIASEDRCPFGGGCKSLDDADSTNPTSPCQTEKSDKSGRKSKSRNPVSPGSKLATLFNALFTPTAGKKKPQPNQRKDGEEIPCVRMKRRSSMSYAQSVSDSTATSPISASGFHSPDSPCSHPRIWNGIDGFSNSKARSVTLFPPATAFYEKRCINIAWLDQKFLFSDADYENFNHPVKNKDGYSWKENDGGKDGELIKELQKKVGNTEKEWRIREEERTDQRKKEMKWLDECSEEEAAKKAKEETEDGFESDSSDDLFELPKL